MKIYLNNQYIKDSVPISNEFQIFIDQAIDELENLNLLDSASSKSATYDKPNNILYIVK